MYKQLLLMLSLIFALSISAQDIKLDNPNKSGGKPLMQALSERKSNREFQSKELPVSVLSDLLWAANGFNRPANRTAPTANDRQEIELYVTLKSGVYWYDAKNQLLKLIKSGDYRESTGSQDFVATAPLNVIFVADMNKTSSRDTQSRTQQTKQSPPHFLITRVVCLWSVAILKSHKSMAQ